MFKYASVTISGVITAPAERLFAIVTDVRCHPELAGSSEVRQVEWLTPEPIQVGSHFRSCQQIGPLRYQSHSFVQIYEPSRKFTWLSGIGFRKPPFGQLWGFEFVPQGEFPGALVMHSMTIPIPVLNVAPFASIADAVAHREAQTMAPTLTNLARLANAKLIGETRIVLAPCPSQGSLLMAGH